MRSSPDARAPKPPPDDTHEDEPPADPESVARTICLTALTQRARTRSELADLLRKRGVPNEPAEHVLSRLSAVGLIDDRALAASFTAAAHDERGLSRRAVADRLRKRGVADEVIADAVNVIDSASEREAAVMLARRRAAALQGLPPDVVARRLVGFLARRGYSLSMVHAVAREVVGERWVESGDAEGFD
jgi:regulatory protein